VKAVAIDLAAIGDTEPLFRDWLEDAGRRFRIDVDALDEQLPNWRALLGHFAEERAPVYFRRDPDVSGAMRRLEASGTKIGVFTDVPEELARVALTHLGALGRIDALEAGGGSKDRVLTRFGDDTTVIETRAELLGLT
jgi:phosphoglycolate phosphatase-like HAD superfamily hydrolase